MAIKVFNYNYAGLVLQTQVDDLGNVTVTCLQGHADINALYWGDATAEGSQFSLGKNLDMNGVAMDFDAGVKLSDPGAKGVVGGIEAKVGYVTENGEPFTYHIDLASVGGFDGLETFGIRATSTSAIAADGSTGGSIKGTATELHLGSEIVQNWDFEAQKADVPDGGFQSFGTATGWQNLSGQNVELQSVNYTGNMGTGSMAGSNEQVWLDGSNSPGDIHLQTVADLSAGSTGELTVSVAMQDILYNGQQYTPDADDHFKIIYDGNVVFDFDKTDFVGKNANEFYEFTTTVNGTVNPELLEVLSTGNIDYTDGDGHHGYASFALDHVSLKEWIA